MKVIQFILIPLVLVTMLVYLTHVKSRIVGRIVIIFAGLIASLMVLSPDIAQNIAGKFGVGRGTDLVFYLGFLGLCFICSILFSKLRHLENQLTELARAVALIEAEKRPPCDPA
ncbi:DUF2304 domain-containing protein [Omnitrophica bacterium]|nr:DUF2304 domain-containing protein [Candidatus Omnitrophota bacterium]